MALSIAPGLEIPDQELSLSFVRGSGPGGQNVNKVATAVQLRYDLARSRALGDEVKLRLRALSGRRLTADGAILIVARTHRTQERNRREAERRLTELIRRALIAPKVRRPTRPTRASTERRLEHKARNRRTKRLRRLSHWEE
ncbi:MAG TPA: alternative ribosome rescue aminoacyl-tRNA hydrolase ArfB [Steroidobacteraceae bacterium]|nr:alternative ribosome rescue aminoacyl-tRNA hydrolase ArfB [Steroidobacteraceae bacterium]